MTIKKLFFSFFVFHFSFFVSPAQQTTLQKAADDASSEIVQKVRLLPPGSKISLCLFMGTDQYIDTLRSRLGMMLTEKIYHSLINRLNKRDYEILFPENFDEQFILEASQKNWMPPSTVAEEDKFWKEYNGNRSPDYYLTGKYFLSATENQILVQHDIAGCAAQSDQSALFYFDHLNVFIINNKWWINYFGGRWSRHQAPSLDTLANIYIANDLEIFTSKNYCGC